MLKGTQTHTHALIPWKPLLASLSQSEKYYICKRSRVLTFYKNAYRSKLVKSFKILNLSSNNAKYHEKIAYVRGTILYLPQYFFKQFHIQLY